MGMSETIVAAMIGALATVVTAVIQLLRNRPPSDSRPKKNRLRSALATTALAIACVVGGYAWSSLRAVNAKEELRATMKSEFAEQFAAFAARARQEETEREALRAAHRPVSLGLSESIAHLPPCRIDMHPDEVGPVTCSARAAHTVSLCAAVPAATTTTGVRVFTRLPNGESHWQEREGGAPTLGSVHFGEAPEELPVTMESRSVCLDVANWSVEDTVAVRLIVDYTAVPPVVPELTAAAPGGAAPR